MTDRRAQLRQLFAAALAQLRVEPHVRQALAQRRALLATAGSVLVIAFGKAARPMAAAALAELQGLRLRGLLVPPVADAAPLPPFEVIAGGHPLPTDGSLRAAARALELCRTADPRDHVLFLVSGGGSAMLELPAEPSVSLAEVQTLYRALVGCGAPIQAVNTVRKHLSAVKGGKLAQAAAHSRGWLTLAVADVPGNDLAALASGPTLPDHSTAADCLEVLSRWRLQEAVPPALRARLRAEVAPPALGSRAAERSEAMCVLDSEHAQMHLGRAAAAAGLPVVVDNSMDDQPVARAAAHLLRRLGACRQDASGPVAVIAAGEQTVQLPERPGVGGRNQHFALHCALQIEGQPITVLSAGTDGIDGNSPAAGAVADGATVARARAQGLAAADFLARFDSHPLFAALGDAIVTGPTGTNVRDLRILVHE